ncbi:MAG: hydroxyacylglutathione hydrolase [Hyphomicrobiaceae bacterium]
MSVLEIRQFPCLSDNFGVIVRDPATGVVASVDAPEAKAVEAALASAGWKLTHILVTHHHADHTDGIAELKQKFGATVIGPKGEGGKIKGLDQTVGGGDSFKLGALEVRVLDTPGHTLGHITYWLPEAKVAFVGDTLFSLGCGRVIEGDMRMMWTSLAKLAALPPETSVYCGHEYTLANANFSMTIEPENAALQARAKEVETLRAAGKPTLPTTIGQELATNPFLRPASPDIRKRLGLAGAEDWQVFSEVRERKNKA